MAMGSVRTQAMSRFRTVAHRRPERLAAMVPDQCVGAGGRESEIPGTKIPEDGGNEEREDHGEAGAAADLQDEFDRQERDDTEGDRAGGSDDAEEVPEAAPGDREVGIKRVSINNGGQR